jgi:catechol 1,2-dioxygenase
MPDDPHIDDDVQFGVTKNLIGNLVRHDEAVPDRGVFESPWYSLEHTFFMDPGEARLPAPPIK